MNSPLNCGIYASGVVLRRSGILKYRKIKYLKIDVKIREGRS
nr:MAG TPA: hypothetical protein [Caudoviricetes sp.]